MLNHLFQMIWNTRENTLINIICFKYLNNPIEHIFVVPILTRLLTITVVIKPPN